MTLKLGVKHLGMELYKISINLTFLINCCFLLDNLNGQTPGHGYIFISI